jgi:hypothetical protein
LLFTVTDAAAYNTLPKGDVVNNTSPMATWGQHRLGKIVLRIAAAIKLAILIYNQLSL